MDVLTFLSETIRFIAWPATSVVLVALLRKPIIELIPLLRRLKYKELELEFSQKISALEDKAESMYREHPENEEGISQGNNHILNLAAFSTRAAIMEAWLELESAAIEVASSFWNQPPSNLFKNNPKMGKYLWQCNVLNKKQLDIFNTLRQLRNKAAHAEELEGRLNLQVQHSPT